jgi:alkanesulfonate monooxygenase SsuD/methylene tetrahydromethanopterin reductase-like flavin-dependent oxidoreductase (luciferase family)
LVSCLVGNDDRIINDILNQRKKRVYGMQQVREAENASLVGLPENIISGLNKYVKIGITHFIMDFVGLTI